MLKPNFKKADGLGISLISVNFSGRIGRHTGFKWLKPAEKKLVNFM